MIIFFSRLIHGAHCSSADSLVIIILYDFFYRATFYDFLVNLYLYIFIV